MQACSASRARFHLAGEDSKIRALGVRDLMECASAHHCITKSSRTSSNAHELVDGGEVIPARDDDELDEPAAIYIMRATERPATKLLSKEGLHGNVKSSALRDRCGSPELTRNYANTKRSVLHQLL